jgi:hypothetical protein
MDQCYESTGPNAGHLDTPPSLSWLMDRTFEDLWPSSRSLKTTTGNLGDPCSSMGYASIHLPWEYPQNGMTISTHSRGTLKMATSQPSPSTPNTEYFSKTRGELYTNVPSTINRMDKLWGAEPDKDLLGPFEDEDALMTPSHTRHLMYVPPKYVPIVANQRLTPKELWFELVSTIRADGAEEDCYELINWCILAATGEDDTLPSAIIL